MTKRSLIVVAVTVFALSALLPALFAQRYSDWLPPVHLDVVNSDLPEMTPVISRDGLTLYFLRGNASGGALPLRWFVAHRASVDEPWGPPEELCDDLCLEQYGELLGDGLFLSRDGHTAYFSRVEENGKQDLYVSRRRDARDDLAWRTSPVENLGPSINTADTNEYYPFVYEDEVTGETHLYFASDRGGKDDIYVSTLQDDGNFSDPVPVVELNSVAADRRLQIRRDGLECVFMSNRAGSIANRQGQPSYDLWFSTRASTSDPWSLPQNMGNVINTGRHEGAPYYSFDGSELYFMGAQREGNIDPTGEKAGIPCALSATCYFDLWVVSREKPGHERH